MEMKPLRLAIVAAVLTVSALVVSRAPADAAPISVAPMTSVAQQLAVKTGGTVVEKVRWRGGFCYRHPRSWRCLKRVRVHRYCRNWRGECAERWGWHTPRYRRCLRRHGC
jgi:hypothetical protein